MVLSFFVLPARQYSSSEKVRDKKGYTSYQPGKNRIWMVSSIFSLAKSNILKKKFHKKLFLTEYLRKSESFFGHFWQMYEAFSYTVATN